MLFSIFFTAIFLIVNHLHSTVASLIVSKDDDQSLNLAHSLAKRDFVPPDQRCSNPANWVSRRCILGSDDRAWQDECVTRFGAATITTYVISSCPVNTMCSNTLSPEPDYRLIIACINRPEGQVERPPNRQTGVFRVGSDFTQVHTVLVPVLGLLARATVSALIEGM
jgi:hypothetical protein